MSLQQSFSRFRKKAKEKVSKIRDKIGKIRANAGDEGSYRSGLSSQSEPGVVVEGESRGGETKAGVGKDDSRPGDSVSVSRSAVGIGHDHGGSDDGTSGRETDQKGLHPHLQAESGSSRGKKVDRAHPLSQSNTGNETTPPPSIFQGGEAESTWTRLFESPPLTDCAGNPAAPDPVHADGTTSNDKPDWKHTASSAAKLLVRTVERTSDVFPPLKSVAAGLCAILDNCEVRFTIIRSIRDFTPLLANGRQRTDGGIIGIPGRGACRISLRTWLRG